MIEWIRGMHELQDPTLRFSLDKIVRNGGLSHSELLLTQMPVETVSAERKP